MTMHPLTPVDTTQGRMYCGPTVLALLTGKSRAEIHRDANKIRRKAGKKRNKWSNRLRCWKRVPWPLTAPVKGMSNATLQRLMNKYGLSTRWYETPYPSLRRMIEDVGHFKMPLVINVTHHYVLYFQGKIYDTFCKEGALPEEHPCIGKRVQTYWTVKIASAQAESEAA